MSGPGKPPTINAVSDSAVAGGLGGSPAGSSVAYCPRGGDETTTGGGGGGGSGAGGGDSGTHGSTPKPLDYCDIRQLQIDLSTEGKSKTIVIDRDRTPERVDPDGVIWRYRTYLPTADLVIEALADIQDTTETLFAPNRDAANGSKRGGATGSWTDGPPPPTASKDRKPLDVKVTATNSASHSCFQPAHPKTRLELPDHVHRETDGGAAITGRYWSPNPGGMGNSFWGRVWPFGDNRMRVYNLSGEACGTLPIPQKTNTQLGAKLIVLPYEEWSITIGLKGVADGSYSQEANRFGAQDGESRRTVRRTTVAKNRVGNVETSTKTQEMTTPSGARRVRTEDTRTELKPGMLSSGSQTVTATQESWNKRKRTERDDDFDLRKVTIKHVVGGVEVESEVSDTIKNILKIGDIIKDVSKLFDSVKIGWSISFSYDLLSGNLNLGWGHRWPASYVEDSRVYYVERFVKVGGQVDVVTGSVAGFFGFKVDPWYAPVAIEVGAYLSVTVKVSIAASFTHAYTNPARLTGAQSGSLDPSASIGFEAGGKANGRAFGYSVDSKLALESAATLTFKGEVSSRQPPYLKGTLILGKEHEGGPAGGPKQADALRLIGELIVTGETIRRWKIEPIVLAKGMIVFEDKLFWGEAPKES